MVVGIFSVCGGGPNREGPVNVSKSILAAEHVTDNAATTRAEISSLKRIARNIWTPLQAGLRQRVSHPAIARSGPAPVCFPLKEKTGFVRSKKTSSLRPR